MRRVKKEEPQAQISAPNVINVGLFKISFLFIFAH